MKDVPLSSKASRLPATRPIEPRTSTCGYSPAVSTPIRAVAAARLRSAAAMSARRASSPRVADPEGAERQPFPGGAGDRRAEGLRGFREENGQRIAGGGAAPFEVGHGRLDVVQ